MLVFCKWIFVFIFAVFGHSVVKAGPLPEYEGVYLETTSGELIQIPALSPSFESFRATQNKTVVQPFSIDDVKNAPVVDAKDVAGIVINTRSERINRLNMVVRAEDYLGPYVNTLRGFDRDNEAFSGFKFNFAEDAEDRRHLVVGNWGWGRDNFQIQNIDQFNTRYKLKNSTANLSKSINSGVLAGTESDEIEVFGFAVQTDDANYVFFTPQMRGAYAKTSNAETSLEVVYLIGVNRTEMQVRELDSATNRFTEVIVAFVPGEDEVPAVYNDARIAVDTRYRIAVAEGATAWQIVEALKATDFLSGDVFFPPEGSIAPGSYQVSSGGARNELLAQMKASQAKILAESWKNRGGDLPIETPQQAMVLASIIEKETGVPDERRQIASVFVNRLRQGMKLQTDPTVIYGITNGQGGLGRGLLQRELRSNSPFNTYVIEGLPPTPIANPGREAIEAALNPDDTSFIFFVADGSGGHVFATTLAEHNLNVRKWRKIEANSK